MLVLNVPMGKSIIINDNIKVTMLGFSRNQVRVGTEAPREIPVHRKEIHDKIKAEGSKHNRGPNG